MMTWVTRVDVEGALCGNSHDWLLRRYSKGGKREMAKSPSTSSDEAAAAALLKSRSSPQPPRCFLHHYQSHSLSSSAFAVLT